jgi:hypothetical protein
MKKLNLIYIIAIMLTASCKTQTPLQSFSLGKGGGFTGKYDEYQVKSNGEVYNISNGQSPVLFKTFSKDQIKDIFRKFDGLNISSVNFSHPGNMTSYIRCEINNKTWEIKWGDAKYAPPQNVFDFFEAVWSDIRPK